MENAKAVRAICDKYKVLMVIDGCRIAENSYFVKHREEGYAHKSYKAIAREMLELGDAFIMSAKKDGMVNMGGLLCVKDQELYRQCTNQLIISEGFTTYGGLSGRDMEALAIGLEEVFDEHYLEYRIRSTAYLGEGLRKKGIPVIWPIGGHAVYIDAHKLMPNIPKEQFPAQVLVCELYKIGGIRAVEIGSLMFGTKDQDGNFVAAQQELVRLAIPRRLYTQSHIDYVLEAFDGIKDLKNNSKGYKIVYEPPFLRHFTARLEPIK
jgi:tryptophanase